MTIVNMVGGGASSTKYAQIPTTKRIGRFVFNSSVGVTSKSGDYYRWSPTAASSGYISLFNDESGDYAVRIKQQCSVGSSRSAYRMNSGASGSIVWDADFKAYIESKVLNMNATLVVGASNYYNTSSTPPQINLSFKVTNGVLQDTTTTINGYYTSDSILRNGDSWELFTVLSYISNISQLELK